VGFRSGLPREVAPDQPHWRGAAKKKSTDPPVHLLNPRPTHPPAGFFSLVFLSTVLGVSRQSEFKNTIKLFLQKCQKKIPNKSTKISMSVFPRLFCFIAGVSQRWEFKNTTKNVLQKNRVEKLFTKNSTKNPEPTFSRFFVYYVFGRFAVRGVQKRRFWPWSFFGL
jgi:hypothetical protein